MGVCTHSGWLVLRTPMQVEEAPSERCTASGYLSCGEKWQLQRSQGTDPSGTPLTFPKCLTIPDLLFAGPTQHSGTTVVPAPASCAHRHCPF